MIPNKDTEFLPLTELSKYYDTNEYFCYSMVFDPSERKLFEGCPPYIQICSENDFDLYLYFEIPEILALYGKDHAGYTFNGRDELIKRGKRELGNQIKQLLNID